MAEPMTSILEVQVKCPEVEELVNDALDEFEYKGRTLRQWADSIVNPKTNADRIRSMSDEELAKWIVNIAIQCTAVGGKSDYLTNETCWLDWLKKEADDDRLRTDKRTPAAQN